MNKDVKWLKNFMKNILLRYYYLKLRRSEAGLSSENLMLESDREHLESWFRWTFQIKPAKGEILEVEDILAVYPQVEEWDTLFKNLEDAERFQQWELLRQGLEQVSYAFSDSPRLVSLECGLSLHDLDKRLSLDEQDVETKIEDDEEDDPLRFLVIVWTRDDEIIAYCSFETYTAAREYFEFTAYKYAGLENLDMFTTYFSTDTVWVELKEADADGY